MTDPTPTPAHPLTAALCEALRTHEPPINAANMVDYTPGETSMQLDGWWYSDDVEQILRDLPHAHAAIPEPDVSRVIFRADRRVRDMLRDFIGLGLHVAAAHISTDELLLWIRDLFASTYIRSNQPKD